jgi:hypothetical protein
MVGANDVQTAAALQSEVADLGLHRKGAEIEVDRHKVVVSG